MIDPEDLDVGDLVRLTDADRAMLREAAAVLLELVRKQPPGWEQIAYLAGRLDGLAGRVPQVDSPN